MIVFASSILVSEFARAKHQRTAACKVVSEFARASEFVSDVRIRTCFRIRVRRQNLHVLQNSCQVSEFARASEFVLKNEGCAHPRYKNDPLLSLTHLLKWPPLTLMLLGPRASLNTRHVHCFSKQPWCWINAKVKLSVLRCGQVELFLSFRVRFECSKVDKCVLTSSLLIIKQGKYRKLKDEIDDFDFDDVVQQCLFLFLFMPQKFVHSVDNKHVHTIVLPFLVHSFSLIL